LPFGSTADFYGVVYASENPYKQCWRHVEAVEQNLKSARDYWHRQKWLIVYNGLVDPRPASAIASEGINGLVSENGAASTRTHRYSPYKLL